MAFTTPFFSAMGPLLFGRPPRSFRAELRSQAAHAESLSQLREALGPMVPDALLAQEKSGSGSRMRVFSPLITFWAFLAQVLSPNSACREALRKVQAWWSLRHGVEVSPSTSAYCQARGRLSDHALANVHAHLAERMEANVPSDELWMGRNVKIVDGTNLTMPDTAENQKAYPQPSSQKPGCGFPMMKLLAVFSLASGALLHFARGNLRAHEGKLFRSLWEWLVPGDVILSDRGFCSFFAIASLLHRQVDSVMRLQQCRIVDFRRGKRLGHDDRLIHWQRPSMPKSHPDAQAIAALPPTLALRQIRLHVAFKGSRTRLIVLVTTLLDPIRYPADKIRALYMERWGVELHFREIKIVLALDILRCLTPDMVEKELLVHMIAYNLIRSLMQHAALRHRVDLGRISFKGTLDTLRHFADAVQAAHGKPHKQAALLDAMLANIAKDLVPFRPNRSEPRAKKRRPKNYHLLNEHRHKMGNLPHRNTNRKNCP